MYFYAANLFLLQIKFDMQGFLDYSTQIITFLNYFGLELIATIVLFISLIITLNPKK